MKKLLYKHLLIIITVIVFFAIALFNSLMYVELNPETDSIEGFIIALSTHNPFIGTSRIVFSNKIPKNNSNKIFGALFYNRIYFENHYYEAFPCFSRYIPGIIPHLSVTLPHFLFGINDIRTLLKIFTFVLHFTPIIFLFIIYLLLPEKDKFGIILLSFLSYIVYLRYYALSEIILATLFSWIIFIFYLYKDFDTLSPSKATIPILFSFFLIFCHPIVVLLIPILFVLGISKISKTNNKILIASLFLLFIAFIFNMFYVFSSLGRKDAFYSFESLRTLNMYFIVSVILILIATSLKNKTIRAVLIILLSSVICITVLKTYYPTGFNSRIFAVYITFLFMLFMIFSFKFKIDINYKWIRFVNIILIASILTSSIVYAKIIYNHNAKIAKYMQNHEFIKMKKFGPRYAVSNKNKYIAHTSLIMNSIFLNSSGHKCKILLTPEEADGYSVVFKTIIYHTKFLKKYNIDIDTIYQSLPYEKYERG